MSVSRRSLRTDPHHGRCEGFTLIEVLVTTLVVGLGLLGLAGLQTASLRNTQTAEQRTEAARLAAEMADRMRANMPGVTAGNYHLNSSTSTVGCFDNSGCTPAEIANDDMAQWRTALRTRLPGGANVTGVVCIDSNPNNGSPTPAAPSCDAGGNVYAIKIWWDDQRTGNPDRFQLLVTSFQP